MVVSKYISAMRTKRFYRPELRASYFSMIELMLVLVVASIVLGITMRPKPAQVDVGVQMISRQIRLAPAICDHEAAKGRAVAAPG